MENHSEQLCLVVLNVLRIIFSRSRCSPKVVIEGLGTLAFLSGLFV